MATSVANASTQDRRNPRLGGGALATPTDRDDGYGSASRRDPR